MLVTRIAATRADDKGMRHNTLADMRDAANIKQSIHSPLCHRYRKEIYQSVPQITLDTE